MSMLTSREKDDYVEFCAAIQRQTGLDLGAYKRLQTERRIRAMAERHGMTDLTNYWQLLRRDAAALRTFLDRVTINVSEFFRNPEKFEELRTQVLPGLLQRGQSPYIWSAGCSYGAEPYSLRILLHQEHPSLKPRLLASDIDTGILARARQGVYVEDDLRNIPAATKQRYFSKTADGGYQVMPICREGIEFTQHNLLRDAFPRNVDLICCRNVVIYFNDDAKERLFTRFFEALRPGGFLLVGSTERIINARQIGFVSTRPFWYQRPL